VEEPADSDSNKEIKSDDIEKSRTLIPPENTLVITEFTNVFPKDSTLIPPEVTPVITVFVDVILKNLLDKLPSMYDTQNTVKSSEVVIYQVDEACESEDIAHNCIR